MSEKKTDKDKLRIWQERLARNDSAYSAETEKMNRREELYAGDKTIKALVKNAKITNTPHVRNICAEIVEAQVSSSIPMPKVTALRPQDEGKAKLIEDMLRNEIDRLPFEETNDMAERTVPIQGGVGFLVEWDNTGKTQRTVGELSVAGMHPKKIIPQDGVYSGIEDMDYIILKLPQTKEYIKRRYGKTVENESETEPDIKGGDESAAEDLVTQYTAYYRNHDGGIGIYAWTGDTELEDIEDYQARRLTRCTLCGTVRTGDEETCSTCGADTWETKQEEYEEIYSDILRSDGTVIPGAHQEVHVGEEIDLQTGLPITEAAVEPTRVPWYKPDIYPIILQKNVSVNGKFLGDSDIDKIETQQNTTNRIHAKIIEKLIKGGSYMALPEDASICVDDEDMKIIRPESPAAMQMIGVYNLEASIAQDMNYLEQIYQEARQVIGITDSFQGRADRTATSGKAKEFAAAQSAGRLESKRVMKNAAYAKLFEAMFKFKLAYADEPRPVLSKDIHGNREYKTFNRYDFLEKDEAGEWYWNDQFLFSCDTTAPLASNREAMWQETRMNFQTGAFGDPASIETLISFWEKMEALHYPTAGETKKELMERLRKQQEAQMRQMEIEREMEMRKAEEAEGARRDAAYRQEAEGLVGNVVEEAQAAAARDLEMHNA